LLLGIIWELLRASIVAILPQVNGNRISGIETTVLANKINVKNIRGIKPKGRDNMIIIYR